MFSIRQEQPGDYAEVYALVSAAFATTDYSDGTEADYLNELRRGAGFIPELSLVATADADKAIVGQLVLCETAITTAAGERTELVLSPLSVRPSWFGRGVARSLVSRAFVLARALGYGAVFLCGAPEIYRKLGFLPAREFGVCHKREPTADWCMAAELFPGALRSISGTVDIV